MTEQFDRLMEVLAAAIRLPADRRADYIEKVCAGDPQLLADAQAKLAHLERAPSILKTGGLDGLIRTDSTRAAQESLDPSTATESLRTDVVPGSESQIGPYRILEHIGEGGMGEVYRAEQSAPIRRTVALKVIKRGMDTKEVIARFEAERQALALMDHPCIAKVFDAGATLRGRPYFVMELVKGVPITTYCDKHKLSTRERLELFMQLCDGVQHAHQKAIIHRDLKPSNVLVTIQDNKPVPKIIDFGVAKATAQKLTDKTMYTAIGELIGTPEYMSPEQAEMTGEDVDTRTDVYALGVILYELLAGALPFDPTELRKAGFEGILHILREKDPPRPSTKVSTLGERRTRVAEARNTSSAKLAGRLRGDLDWITMKALEKDRTRRYGSALEFAADVRRHLSDEPVLAGPPNPMYRFRKFAKRNRVALTVTAVVLLAILGALAESNRQRVIAVAARDESEAVTDFLTDMLASVDPAEEGVDVTVQEVLDEASRTVAQEFSSHPKIEARLRHTIGGAYSSLSKYASAEAHVRRAVELRGRLLGDEHPETLDSRESLARLYTGLGKRSIADSLFAEILEIRRRVQGEEHPATLRCARAFGMSQRAQAHFEKAESLLVSTLHAHQRVFGEDHPETISCMVELASVYFSQKRFDQALPLSQKVVEITRQTLGNEHLRTLESMYLLAAIYKQKERYESAESLYVDIVSARLRAVGEEHGLTLLATHQLGRIYKLQARYAEAESLLAWTLERQRRVYGSEHRLSIMTMHQLALVYAKQGKFGEAETLERENFELRQRIYGEDNHLTAVPLWALHELYRETGQSDKMRSTFLEIRAVGNRSVEKPDANATAMEWYANSLLHEDYPDLQDSQAALKYALEAVEMTNYNQPYHLATLAHAYHANDETLKAVETAKLAVELAKKSDLADVASLEERLAEYEAALEADRKSR